MRLFTQVALIIFAILGVSPNVHAVPTFSWGAPWSVTLNPLCVSGPDTSAYFQCLRSGEKWFGATSSIPGDGLIVNINADQAIAALRSFSDVSGSGVNASVVFSRPFTLSDGGIWDVKLFGDADGQADLSRYTLTASAAIGSLTVGTKFVFGAASNIVSTDGQLLDGSYVLTGQLSANGGAGPFERSSGLAVNWTVGLNATPVPEPAALALLALGLLMLWRTRVS
jgi:hypothetical protein